MRKKFLSIILAAAMTLSLAGCEKTASVPDASVSATEETSVSASSETEVEPEEEEVILTALNTRTYGDENACKVYMMNGSEKVCEYEIPQEIAESAHFFYGDFCFAKVYRKEYEEGQGNDYVFTAYNLKLGKEKELARGTWKGSIDIYDGKVIVTYYDYYSDKYNEKYYDDKTLKRLSGDSDIWENIPTEYQNYVSTYSQGNLRAYSPARFMAEYGYVFVIKDGEKYIYDGNTLTPQNFEGIAEDVNKYSSVKYYTDKNLIVELYDYDEVGGYTLIDYDLATNEKTVITERFSAIDGIEGDVIYYSEYEEDEFSLPVRTLCSYDAKNHVNTKLATVYTTPGCGSDYSIDNITVDNGRVYARVNDGKNKDWCILENGEFKQLNLSPYHYNVPDFGTVEYLSKNIKCEFCGEVIGEFYGEYINLDAKYSDKAAVISESIKKMVEDRCDLFLSEDPYFSESADKCEESGHGSVYGDVTYEKRITDIRVLGDYIAFDMDSYWYGGGAHGMPFNDCHLFNLKTGEEVSFKNLYSGTEEDLKRIAAEKTKEDFSNEDSENYYDWDKDADSVYQHAYDYISFKNFPISYTEDGVVLMYPPYEMASYAQGFVCVFISYEELGITAFN